MVKKIVLFIIALLILPTILAINVEVTPKQDYGVLVIDTNTPALYEITLKNNGGNDFLQFYSLLGFRIAPFGTEKISTGEEKNIQLNFYPPENFNQRGYYTFPYYIRGQDNSEKELRATLKIIELKDGFEVGSGDFDPSSNSVDIYIQNKENIRYDKVNAKFVSSFFNFDKSFSLEPKERKTFTVKLNKEDYKKLLAGFYTLNTQVNVDKTTADIEGVIKFVEKDIVTTNKKEYGFFINTNIIKKTNEGNVVANSETTMRRNIVSRLFTTITPEPDIVDREGWNVFYSWKRDLKPGDSLEIRVTTNWFFPFLIIFFIVVITVLVRKYTTDNVELRKKVAFVKTKGGEFALKVSITIEAKKHVDKITIVDRIPSLVKIYEKFPANDRPSKVDFKNRRIEWNLESLNQGEKRTLSYIIFSKVGVMGKFELPSATAIYECNGKVVESTSDRAFFVSEQRSDFVVEE